MSDKTEREYIEGGKADKMITVRDLFFYILRKWRTIIILGFGCAFLFGACRGIKLLSMVQSNEYQEKVKTRYEDKLKDRESKEKKIDREIAQLEMEMDAKKEYQEQSLLMAMDPQDSWIASADIYLSDVSGTSASVLSSIFQAALNNGSITQKLADMLHVDEKYIRELVRTQCQEYTTEYPRIEQAYMLTDQVVLHIGLIAGDKETARDLMEGIVGAFEDLRSGITGSGISFDLRVLNETYVNRIVQELENYQYSVRDTIESITDELDSCRKEKDELEKDVYKAPWSAKEIVLSGFKFFLLGGFIGGCLSLVILLVACLYTDKILSPEELRKRTGLNVIMVSELGNKHWGAVIDKFITNHELSRELFLLKSMRRLALLDNATERYITWGDPGKEILNTLIPASQQKMILNMDEMESWDCLLPEKGVGENGHTKYVLIVKRGKTAYREIDNKLEVIRRLGGQDIMFVVRV